MAAFASRNRWAGPRQRLVESARGRSGRRGTAAMVAGPRWDGNRVTEPARDESSRSLDGAYPNRWAQGRAGSSVSTRSMRGAYGLAGRWNKAPLGGRFATRR
jgi:hypothetical protein